MSDESAKVYGNRISRCSDAHYRFGPLEQGRAHGDDREMVIVSSNDLNDSPRCANDCNAATADSGIAAMESL